MLGHERDVLDSYTTTNWLSLGDEKTPLQHIAKPGGRYEDVFPRTKTTPIPDVRLVRDEDGSVSSQSGTKKITDEITDTTLEDMGF